MGSGVFMSDDGNHDAVGSVDLVTDLEDRNQECWCQIIGTICLSYLYRELTKRFRVIGLAQDHSTAGMEFKKITRIEDRSRGVAW
jgi:hypothetical protein